MRKKDKNIALDKLNSIQRKLNYEGHQMTEYKDIEKIAFQIQKTCFKAINQEMGIFQDFQEKMDLITNYEWVEIITNYIEYCKQEIIKEYKLKKLHIKVTQMKDKEIQKKFYKTITQIQEIKKEEIPDEDHIDEVMKYYDEIFHQSKQIITHKRNILENLIFTKEKIIFTKGDYNL